MYKLKDIIASGGKNPKINKAIDRYELSNKEKKDIIDEVKNISCSGGGTSSGDDCENMYISYNKDNAEDFGAFMFASLYGALWKGVPNNGGEKVIANFYIVEQLGGIVAEAAMIPISEKTLSADGTIMTYKDMIADMESKGVSFNRITKEEFYNLQ